MPRAFNEKEKEYIHYKLLVEGKRFLERHGLQKTTVEDITHACGISKGAFYLFYDRKEELFFEICENVETEFRAEIFKDVFQDGLPIKESFKKFLEVVLEKFDKTPLLRNISQGDFDYMMRSLPEDTINAHHSHDDNFSEDFYTSWKAQGIFREADPKGFAGLLKLLFYLILHKEDYDEAQFYATKELYINMLCDYLIR
jgi:AcrR family transcriptional regulator